MVNNTDLYCCKNTFFLKTLEVCFLWGLGLFLGISFSCYFCNQTFSLLHSVILQPISIFFPFINLAFLFLLLICKQGILLFTCFGKAVCFGFTWMSIGYLFGSSCWIIRSLLLFTDSVLCLCLLCCALGFSRRNARRSTSYSIFICCAVFVADYFVLSPFARGLF